VVRIRKLKKDRQHNGQKEKDKQHLQNIIQKTASLVAPPVLHRFKIWL
jgi:hypothetical protein